MNRFSVNYKVLKQRHDFECERYAQALAEAKRKLEEDTDKLTREGQQRAYARLRFIPQASLDIARWKEKMDDPSISDAEKKYRIEGEIRECEAIKRKHTRELSDECCHEKNEFIRKGELQELEHCEKLTEKEKRNYYRLF